MRNNNENARVVRLDRKGRKRATHNVAPEAAHSDRGALGLLRAAANGIENQIILCTRLRSARTLLPSTLLAKV